MHRLIATWFGTGLILGKLRGSDSGSGTVASAFAMLVWWALTPFEWWVQFVVALVVAGLSLWSARPFAGAHADPPWVVIDEAAGALIATIGLTGWPVVAAWCVFRLADILKRVFPGVAAAEKLPGPIGVTADDLVAGLYGLAAGWAVQWALA